MTDTSVSRNRVVESNLCLNMSHDIQHIDYKNEEPLTILNIAVVLFRIIIIMPMIY